MADEYWIAGLVYSPLPGRTSPRRRFIRSPFPPMSPRAVDTPNSLASPLPSPPITPNSITPPPPRRADANGVTPPPHGRPKSRTARRLGGHDRAGSTGSVVLGGHERQPSGGQTGSSPPGSSHRDTTVANGANSPVGSGTHTPTPKRIMLRELLPRVLATPALEGSPDDLNRFGRLQTLALHIFQDPCAFDQDDLSRFLAQPLAPDALRAFSDAVLDAWGRSEPAHIRIPPNAPIRIVNPNADLSNLEASPLELCSAATCACLLWTNMYPERWLQVSRASHARGGGALDLTAEVRPYSAPSSGSASPSHTTSEEEETDLESCIGVPAYGQPDQQKNPLERTLGKGYLQAATRSGMGVLLLRARLPRMSMLIGSGTGGESVAGRVRTALLPWQKASHPAILPLLGVTLTSPSMHGGYNGGYSPRGHSYGDEELSLVYAGGPSRVRLPLALPKTVNEAYRLMRSLAKAMRYLHQLRPPLVHGGVRPDTVLVSPTTGDVTLSESGIAKVIEDLVLNVGASGTKTGEETGGGQPRSKTVQQFTLPQTGAVRYSAPELYGENGALARRTTRSDVYAFGCILYEVFTGTVPFHSIPEERVPRALYDGQTLTRPSTASSAFPINDDLWTLIQRCTAFDLSRRPAMVQVVGMLGAARHGPATTALGSPRVDVPPVLPVQGVDGAIEATALMALVESASKIAQGSPMPVALMV